MKASFRGSRTTSQNVNIQLGLKPSGCVVWIRFDKETLDLGPFFFFGGRPGRRLPGLDDFRVARHTKADTKGHKKKRPTIRVIPKGQFKVIGTIEELAEALFGKLSR